jgi:transcriptional regulator with XRE-family HTH domain
MTNVQKNEILQLIEDEKERLGSYRAVAGKCKLSEATISQLRKGSYAAEGSDVYETIALALGYEFDNGNWNIAETTNFRIITDVLRDAKNESMFIGISHKAGSGKTATANVFLQENKRNGVFKINCKEWTGRTFLTEIAREIGAEIPKGYATVTGLITSISEATKGMYSRGVRPLIILDQANSLKPSALRSLIYIFNECEDILGLVILGTENLEYEIKRGVRLNKAGYDELDSRFGRRYINLIGSNLADTRKVCDANSIADKDMQKRIFEECEPSKITLSDGRRIDVVEDMRRLKRIIKREKLNMKHNGN